MKIFPYKYVQSFLNLFFYGCMVKHEHVLYWWPFRLFLDFIITNHSHCVKLYISHFECVSLSFSINSEKWTCKVKECIDVLLLICRQTALHRGWTNIHHQQCMGMPISPHYTNRRCYQTFWYSTIWWFWNDFSAYY